MRLCSSNFFEPDFRVFGSVPTQWFAPPAPAAIVVDVETPRLSVALERYYSRFGHLPLWTTQTIESVVAAWIDRNKEAGVWDDFHAWANDPTRPLKRYHAARVVLRRPSIVPEHKHAAIWMEVQHILAGYADEKSRETVAAQGWRMVHLLAGHFMLVQEIHSHESDEGTLAELAWWMAERVTQVLLETGLREHGPEKAGTWVRRLVEGAL